MTVEAKRRVEGLSQGCCAVFNQSDWALAGFSVSDFETTGSVLVHSQKEKVSRIPQTTSTWERVSTKEQQRHRQWKANKLALSGSRSQSMRSPPLASMHLSVSGVANATTQITFQDADLSIMNQYALSQQDQRDGCYCARQFKSPNTLPTKISTPLLHRNPPILTYCHKVPQQHLNPAPQPLVLSPLINKTSTLAAPSHRSTSPPPKPSKASHSPSSSSSSSLSPSSTTSLKISSWSAGALP